jgi:hypothetical protein
MSTKVKTPATSTPTPAAPATAGKTLFEGQEPQADTEAAMDVGGEFASGLSDPPEASLQRAEDQGHHFDHIEVAVHRPAIRQYRVQRQAMEGVKEHWEDGAVSLKAIAGSPLAASVSPYADKWEDGAVTLKSQPPTALPLAPDAVQREGDGSFTAGTHVENRLNSSKGGGKPLPDQTRDFMETRFGNDFSQVRIHDNAESVQMSQDLKAQAFTHGNDIYFNSGKYNPGSTSGKRLLAHELTHTIQQTGPSAISPKRLAKKAEKTNKRSPQIAQSPLADRNTSDSPLAGYTAITVQPKLVVGAVGDRYEQEADRVADQVVQWQAQSATESVQRSDNAPDGTVANDVTGETVAPTASISSIQRHTLQRSKKDDIKDDVRDAIKGINQEVDGKTTAESEDAEADKGARAGKDLADEAKRRMGDVDDEDKAKKQAKKLKKKAKAKSKKVTEEADQVQENKAKQQKNDQVKGEAEELAEAKKQAKDSEEADPTATETAAVEDESPPADGSADAGEDTGPVAPIGVPQHLPDPGPVTPPKVEGPQTPASADEDLAFAAVVDQSQHLAAQQSLHQPAEDKALEAQEAAQDPAQQSRRAQSTQSNEAGEKEPQLFNREAFVTALLSVLESNKPKSQKDVEQGKGMDGASEKMTEEIAKAKEGSGGELTESATRPPDLEAEEPKAVTPTPTPEQEAGEKPADELIDAAAATPKPKSAEEIEQPLQETQQAIADLVPKTKSDLPPLQAKLTVGAPGDKYEREADHMADTVMAISEPKALTAPPKANKAPGAIAQSPEPLQTSGMADSRQEPVNPETLQRQPQVTQLPDVQLLPGLFLQRKASLAPETLTQKGNAVPLDEHRLKHYEKEAGVDATGALDEGKKHFGGEAQQQFRQAESDKLSQTQATQSEAIATNNQDMFATRMAELSEIQSTQEESKTEDESSRDQVTQAVQSIYGETKLNVDTILTRMDERVNAEFTATDKRAKAAFERRQKQLFKAWKQDYYGKRHPLYIPWIQVKTGWAYVKIRFYLKPFFNTPLWLVNKIFTGLPDEVNQIYEVAREDYLAVQREGVHRIADIVEEEMANAKAEVDRGRQRVQSYVETLPDELKSVGAEAASNIQAQFDSLETSIQNKQQSLVADLKTKYEESLQAIDDRIEELKAANASLVSKIADALAEIGKWILRQVVNILKPPLSLIPGIGSKVGQFLDAFIDDPGGIMKTLFKGMGEGFKNFGKNIMKHMINGFFEWLLGSGIQIKFPDKFDLQGVIDILMQILGVSQDAILRLATMLLPDWAVELLEMLISQGLGALSNLTETLVELGVPDYVLGFFKAIASFPQKGVLALWDFIKTMFSSLKGEFITTIITQLIVPEVVVAGIQWLVGLLNPVGGIFKIVKGIVDVITFLIDNRALILNVLNSIAATFSALIAKSWSPIALAVEMALADIIPLALGLFVSLLGLGGIPKKISKVVEKLRTPVDKGLAKVFGKIGFLLDPVGSVQNGVSGLRDKATSKRNKKTGKDDGDRDTETKSTSKQTGSTPSTKAASRPADTNSSSKTNGSGKSTTSSKTGSSTSKKNKKTDKNSKKKDDKKKDQNGKADNTKSRLQSAMTEVDNLAETKRDPDTVKRELARVKKKHDLDSIKLTKRGQEKYQVVGKAKAKTSTSKGKKVQRKAAKGNWTDDNNQVTVKKRLKASKSKGGSFTVDAKLMEKDAVLKQVEKTLKRLLKINSRTDVVQRHLTRLKGQYKLKTLKLVKLKPDGSVYQIIGEVSQGKAAQRQAAPGGQATPIADPAVEEAIQRAEGRGQTLAPKVREPLEQAFGMDFSPVRIHTDNEGDCLSRSLDANAFTTGRDIFFRQGTYAPTTQQGQHLLAHELTHVVQQSGDREALPQSQPAIEQRVPRASADPPAVQRSPVVGLWIQRQEAAADNSSDNNSANSDTSGLGVSTGDVASGMAGVAANMAVNAAVSQAGRVAANAVASELMPGAKVKSRITSDKSKLTMNVKVKSRDLGRNRDRDSAFEDEMPDEAGLPDSIINDIVRVIQDIVNQNPDADTVARKLDQVRVMFEMQLVKLISYAEVGQAFEYVIKINGRAKFLRASKIQKFLKRLGAGKGQGPSQPATDRASAQKTRAASPEDRPEPTPSQDSAPESPTSSSKAATAQPPKDSQNDPQRDQLTTGTESSQSDQAETASAVDKSETRSHPHRAKVTPSSTNKNPASEDTIDPVLDRQIKIRSQVRRLDAETVDVIIRATPQAQTK